ANLDSGQARGALKQGVGGDAYAGANDSAHIFSSRRYTVEGGGCAEIHDHAGATVFFKCGDSVDDAVGAHLGGIVVMHRHAGFHTRLDEERLGIEVALANLP